MRDNILVLNVVEYIELGSSPAEKKW